MRALSPKSATNCAANVTHMGETPPISPCSGVLPQGIDGYCSDEQAQTCGFVMPSSFDRSYLK